MKSIWVLLTATGFCTSSFAQRQKTDTLYIESVNFRTETGASVSCINFEESFENRIKVAILTSNDTLNILDSFLSRVKYPDKYEDVDVRAKFIYKKQSGTMQRICMSKFDIVVDGRLIEYDKSFFSFLKGLAAP
jgi:hypothetical protein